MGPKQSKKTKKFQRKHLANEISRRKAAKTAAQRRRAKEMRLAASTLEDGDAGEGSGSEDEADAAAARRPRARETALRYRGGAARAREDDRGARAAGDE